jgi:hypothetical protein
MSSVSKFAFQPLEGIDGFSKRVLAAPVQQIEVDAVDGEALQAPLAGSDGAGARGVVRIDLRNNIGAVSPAFDGLCDHLFRAALTVHLGCVDQRHAEIQAEAQRIRFGLGLTVVLAHVPRAEAEGRHRHAIFQGYRTHRGAPLERRSRRM